MSSRRSEFIREVPRTSWVIRPASRRTRKWWVQVDLVHLEPERAAGARLRVGGELADDPQPLGIAERVQDRLELDLVAVRLVR